MSKVKMFHETGRTMIEMLGVISILGMMALGGAVGVSRAIDVWRAWQVEAQVPQLVRDVKALYAWSEDYGFVGMPLICYNVKVHGAGCNDDDKFVSPWGGQVYVEPINETNEELGETEPVNKGFSIIYTDVPNTIRNQILDGNRYLPMIAEVKENGTNLVFSTGYGDDVDISCETIKCKGDAVCDEATQQCICENGEDPDRGCEAELGSCPVGTSTSGDGGYTGGSDLEGNRCYCQNANTKWNGSTCVDQDGTCSSFADCDRDEYCLFDPPLYTDGYEDPANASIEAPTVGSCHSLSDCGEGRIYEQFWISERSDYCRLNWWTAQDICLSKEMTMVSLEDVGCADYKTKICDSDIRLALRETGKHYNFWTADLYDEDNPNSYLAWYISYEGLVNSYYRDHDGIGGVFYEAVLCRR